jgi:hypothetical protein
MHSKRYAFHRADGVTWELVFEARSGLWHIEKIGARGERVQMSLDEFERSTHGRQLSQQYEEALRRAEGDA